MKGLDHNYQYIAEKVNKNQYIEETIFKKQETKGTNNWTIQGRCYSANGFNHIKI